MLNLIYEPASFRFLQYPMLLSDQNRRLRGLFSYRGTSALSDIEIQLEKSLRVQEFSPSPGAVKRSNSSSLPDPGHPIRKSSLNPRRSNSNANLLVHAPQIDHSFTEASNTSPHSSTSSLSSCEYSWQTVKVHHALLVESPPPLPPKPGTLCSTPQRQDQQSTSIRQWQPSPGKHPFTPRTSRPENVANKIVLSPPISTSMRHSFDSLEISPLSKTSTKTSPKDDLQYGNGMHDNIEQLIRETDAAFHAVGTVLAEARASTQVWENPSIDGRSNSENSDEGQVFGATMRTKLTTAMIPGAAPVVETPKRHNRIPNILSNRKSRSGTSLGYFPRLKLRDVTNNVADVLTGKAFRMEVDEMPNRKPALLPVEDSVKEKESDISINNGIAVTTPTDPFHLENLTFLLPSTRYTGPISPSPVIPLPATPHKNQPQPVKRSVRVESFQAPKNGTKVLRNDTVININSAEFASNQSRRRKSKFKHRPTLSRDQMLKPIPEVNTPLQSPAQLQLQSRPSLAPLHISRFELPRKDHILLPSTSYTLNAPYIKHGHIRIEKHDRDYSLFSPVEERLDWTAFQMAILGTEDIGGGDWRRDWEAEADENEVDGIVDWWGEFGFDGYGSLEKFKSNSPPTPPVVLAKSTFSPPKPRKAHIASYTRQRKPRTWKTSNSPRTNYIDLAMLPTHHGRSQSSPRTPLDVNMPKRYELQVTTQSVPNGRRVSVASLPPSPMLALDQNGDTDARIPMGYNLGHDLGDFLRWEAEHVTQSSKDT